MPDKNATSISGNGNGRERQLPRRQSPRLMGRQPILSLPGKDKKEAITVAIEFAAFLNFDGDGDGNNNNNGDSIGAGGKRKRGTDEEEMEEEVEEEGWQRLSRKNKSGMSNDELNNFFHA